MTSTTRSRRSSGRGISQRSGVGSRRSRPDLAASLATRFGSREPVASDGANYGFPLTRPILRSTIRRRDSRVPFDLLMLRVLVAQRGTGIVVDVCRQLGTASLRTRDESRCSALRRETIVRSRSKARHARDARPFTRAPHGRAGEDRRTIAPGCCLQHPRARGQHDHVHVVLGWMERDIRKSVGAMKSHATRVLRAKGHFVDRPVWADHGWNVFLHTRAEVDRAIRFVQNNPIREGKPAQRWHCVKPWTDDDRRDT